MHHTNSTASRQVTCTEKCNLSVMRPISSAASCALPVSEPYRARAVRAVISKRRQTSTAAVQMSEYNTLLLIASAKSVHGPCQVTLEDQIEPQKKSIRLNIAARRYPSQDTDLINLTQTCQCFDFPIIVPLNGCSLCKQHPSLLLVYRASLPHRRRTQMVICHKRTSVLEAK